MPNIIEIHGKKEVKFVEVNKEKNKISIYFKDFTYVMIDDVKIIFRE
jgi:hypothetical protein